MPCATLYAWRKVEGISKLLESCFRKMQLMVIVPWKLYKGEMWILPPAPFSHCWWITYLCFLHFCLFRFPPSPHGTCVLSTVHTASLRCWPNLNSSCVKAGGTVDSKLRKCLRSGKLLLAWIRISYLESTVTVVYHQTY